MDDKLILREVDPTKRILDKEKVFLYRGFVLVDLILTHEIPIILMVGPYVLSRNRWVKRKLGYRELLLVFFSPYNTIPKKKI